MAEALCSADLAKKTFVTFKPMGRNLHRDLPLERTGQRTLALRNAVLTGATNPIEKRGYQELFSTKYNDLILGRLDEIFLCYLRPKSSPR